MTLLLITLAYIAVGVQTFRLMVRWIIAEFPSSSFDGADVAFAVFNAVLWPICLPLSWALMGDHTRRKNPGWIIAGVKKFAGVKLEKRG